ncbi:unnamed protein product [Meganyctiphanes norvegica]|uniref:Uncharacterized protein n=1 Tax=Meganyctiphanes norvegica TaxID=48144 RepID=A0AAV2SHI2_MEGNR
MMNPSTAEELSLTQRTMIYKDMRPRLILKCQIPQKSHDRSGVWTYAWKIIICLCFLIELFALKVSAEDAGSIANNSSPIKEATVASNAKVVTTLKPSSNSSLSKTEQVVEQSVAILPNEENDEELALPGVKINSGALLRGFYVLMVLGLMVLIYVAIKTLRHRRRRSTRKYRPLPRGGDDQEMFPLAADDGDDEEIFNAAEHQGQK